MKSHILIALGMPLFAIAVRAQEATPAPVPSVETSPVPAQTIPAPDINPNATPEPTEPPETVVSVVVERSSSLLGKAKAASEGVVGPAQLERRPILRPGEILETVPGVIITQHSGSGKANQYFLRGFNLDHGTDLGVSLDGMPLNLRTHAHGQGYIDLNLLIPELVSGLRYRKGAYEADQGDFSSAGSIDLSYARKLGRESGVPAHQDLEIGTFGYRRLLLTGSPVLGKGNFVYGLEASHYDGPWALAENYRKLNFIGRYAQGNETRGATLTGMAYDGKWNSTDQIPLRAVQDGLISRFGNIDPTDGGKSHRFSLSGQSWSPKLRASVYAVDYSLNLFSNFTYFLDNPERGDQFEQEDRRKIYGFELAHDLKSDWGARKMVNTFGVQGRYDDIGKIGLFHTQNRVRFETVREDAVQESSVAPYFQNQIAWNSRFRSTVGARYDAYRFRVDSSIPANSGKVSDAILSPKASLAYRLKRDVESYVSIGRGFHSNDARGTTITVDPGDPNVQAERVTPLVRSNFGEVGLRRSRGGFQSTLALFGLDFQSELLFVGDAGTTEASRPSRRVGIEFTNYYDTKKGWVFDADLAYARARFRDADPVGARIPGALEGIVALGATYERERGITGALRLRYFGPRPLIEDNSVRSSLSALVNARLGYKWKNGWRANVDIFNLLNKKVSDIDYYYASRLPGEAAGGVDDVHFHPSESRSVRFGILRTF